MNKELPKNNLNFFDRMVEFFSYVQIALSPAIAGLLVGTLMFFTIKGNSGLTLGIIISSLGLISGIYLASKVKRKYGAHNFMSRLNASPGPDNTQRDNAEAEVYNEYDVVELTKDLNPAIRKGMTGTILLVYTENQFEVEFVKEDGGNFSYNDQFTFCIDRSFIKHANK